MSTTQNDHPDQDKLRSTPIKELMPQAGDRLGNCRIIELIAAGGMANVYKIWHEQLEVVRALKILKPGFDEESKSRLETEAKISANLRHVNIVEIYGIGYWNSIPYIEMEFVDGASLKELLDKNGRLPIPFAIALTHKICTALQFAHNQDLTLYGKVYDSLIHRDIKPANILISSKGMVKLADFGIARPSDVSLHTVGTKVMGTFAYLSPEQLNGEKLDQRSDIYALGTVLYEMLTGSKTFPQKMLADLIHRKTKGQYVPLNSICKDAPKNLCIVVEKALTLDKNKRYSEATDFDQELVSILKKLSTHQPDEIIRHYIKNPQPIPKQGIVLKKNLPVPMIIIVFVFIFASLAGVYLLNHYWDKLFKDTQIIEIGKVPELPKPTAKKPVRFDTIKEIISPKQPSAVVPLPPNQFDKATRAFKAGDYKSAIILFENLSVRDLDNLKKDTRAVRLLQSYIYINDNEKALAFAESESNNDALFHFLKGELLYKKDELEKAESEFKISRTLQTQFEKNTARSASLYLARIRDALYLLKPNVTNKQLNARAWSAFLEIYCTEGEQSPECIEAKDKAGNLVK